MGITYRKVGDYLIPNIIPNKQPKRNYGKWGMLRQTYLKNHCLVEYNLLVIKAKLITHLNEIDEQAREMHEWIMEQLEKQNPSPDGVGATPSLSFVKLNKLIKRST